MDKPTNPDLIQVPVIDEDELHFDFLRASGPGGQNVNKVATAVQLRFDVSRSPSLPEDVRQRLMQMAKNRINEHGILMIEARRFRTQEQNRQDAISRLAELVRRASEAPKLRKKSRPTEASRLRRLEAKHKRGEIKRARGWKPDQAE